MGKGRSLYTKLKTKVLVLVTEIGVESAQSGRVSISVGDLAIDCDGFLVTRLGNQLVDQ